jgi:hypothetical protein
VGVVVNGAVGIKFKNVYTHTHTPWIHKFVIATVGRGISHKDTNIQINTATTKQIQHKNKMSKP